MKILIEIDLNTEHKREADQIADAICDLIEDEDNEMSEQVISEIHWRYADDSTKQRD